MQLGVGRKTDLNAASVSGSNNVLRSISLLCHRCVTKEEICGDGRFYKGADVKGCNYKSSSEM